MYKWKNDPVERANLNKYQSLKDTPDQFNGLCCVRESYIDVNHYESIHLEMSSSA